jgi:protein-tyrosine-phosphatase
MLFRGGKKMISKITRRLFFRGTARRSLVVLVLTCIAAAPVFAEEGKKNILIVDMGNIMRSVIAEELIKRKLTEDGLSDRFSVSSRGLQGTPATPVTPSHGNLSFYNQANGSNAWESSQPALQKLGIEEAFKEHRSTVVSVADLEQAVIIIVTDAKVMENPEYGLHKQFPGFGGKMILITELVGSSEGIADAYQAGTSGNKYEKTVYKVANVVEAGYKNLLERIK